ncbi:MAG: hypothetical protein ACRCX8_07210 [Sarcina sp.]
MIKEIGKIKCYSILECNIADNQVIESKSIDLFETLDEAKNIFNDYDNYDNRGYMLTEDIIVVYNDMTTEIETSTEIENNFKNKY